MKDTGVPVLYIGVRTEIGSLQGGCLGAQCAHVGGELEQEAFNQGEDVLWEDWCENRLFGKTIILAAPDGINNFLEIANNRTDVTGTLHDPSYRVTDGDLVVYTPMDTLGYILTNNEHTLDRARRLFKLY